MINIDIERRMNEKLAASALGWMAPPGILGAGIGDLGGCCDLHVYR